MERKYGQISESIRINEAIYDCFELLSEKDQKKFVKKFKDIPHTHIQIMHTFSELLLGTYLSANGFLVENDRKIHEKTPDWSIIDSSSNITAIVEMVYHHLDNKTNDVILNQKKAGKIALGYYPNSNDPEHNRIYFQIKEKASKYKELIAELEVPYVVALFINFLAVVDVQEVRDSMVSGEDPLFNLYPDLSGVLYFCEANFGSYYFELIENPYAIREIKIPKGYLMKSQN